MPISFGAKLSSQEANNTFLDKTIDDSTVGKLGLNNPEVESGNEIVNTQRYVNEIAEASGVNGEGDAARNDYSSSEIVDNGDSRKVAIGKLDAQLNDTDSRLEGIEQSIGQPEGLAELDENGFVPTSQLPSFVDDVIEATDFASLPVEGETGKIYVTLDTNRTYRFTGSTYIEVSQSPVDSVNGMTGVVNLDNTSVGLANVTDDAQLKREAGDFNSFTEKEIPVNDDIVLIEDSEDAFNKKKVRLENFLGGGSGNGDVYTYSVFDSSTADLTDFTNVTLNTVNPIGVESDFSVTSFPATLPIIEVPRRATRKLNALEFSYILTGSLDVVVTDQLSNELGRLSLTDTQKVKTGTLQFFVPESVETIRVTFENVAATSINFDSLFLTDDPFTTINLVNTTNEIVSPTITIEGLVTNPTKGTIEQDDWRYVRNGSLGNFKMSYRQSLAGGAGSGNYLVSLPDGLEFPDNQVFHTGTLNSVNIDSAAVVGNGYIASNLASGGLAIAVAYDSRRFRILSVEYFSNVQPWSNTFFSIAANVVTVSMNITTTIKGWEASTENLVFSRTGTENTFSAKIQNNGAASVVSENVSFIDSVIRNSVGNVTVNFKAGVFNVSPVVVANVDGDFSNATSANTFSPPSNLSAVIETRGGNGAFDHDFSIIVQAQGVDYKNPNAYAVVNPVKVAIIKDVKPTNIAGGSSVSGLNTRDLNTLEDPDNLISSLSSNQFTFSRKGRFLVEANAPSFRSDRQKLILSRADLSKSFSGNADFNSSSDATTTRTSISTILEIIDTSVPYIIQHYIQSPTSSNGLGVSTLDGTDNTYTVVKITWLGDL